MMGVGKVSHRQLLSSEWGLCGGTAWPGLERIAEGPYAGFLVGTPNRTPVEEDRGPP